MFKRIGLALMLLALIAFVIGDYLYMREERFGLFWVGFIFASPHMLLFVLSWIFPRGASIAAILYGGITFLEVIFLGVSHGLDWGGWITFYCLGTYLLGAIFVLIGSFSRPIPNQQVVG